MLGKLEQFAGRTAMPDRLADKDDGAFRAEQHPARDADNTGQ